MAFNLKDSIDTNEFNYYRDEAFKNLEQIDDSHPLKIVVASDIALYFCMFDPSEKVSKKEYFEKKVLPMCQTLTEININDTDKGSYSATCGTFHSDDRDKNPKCDINVVKKDESFFGHSLSHEIGHFLSVELNENKDEFVDWKLMTKCRGLEEIFTEYYANCLTNLKREINGEEMEELHSDFIASDDIDSGLPDLEIVSDRAFYGSVEGFAPIIDSVLHNEILNSKIFKTCDFKPYEGYLNNLNKDIYSMINEGMNYTGYENINKSLSNLLTFTMIEKYKNKSNEEAFTDYLNLRENLATYGNPILQGGIIRDLDVLMCERFVGKSFEKMDDYTLSTVVYAFDDYDILNAENKYDAFKKKMSSSFIDIVESPSNIYDKESLTIKDIFEKEDIELIKLDIEDKNLNEFKKLKLGLDMDSKVLADNILFNFSEVRDILINKDFKGSNSFSESISLVREIDGKKFYREFIEGDFFKKALKAENIRVCSDILREVASLEQKDMEKFFKNNNSLIEDNPNLFFSALLYTTAFDKPEKTKRLVEGLSSIDFCEIKNSRGQNFLLFCEDKAFGCNDGRLSLGRDKALGLSNYNYEKEEQLLKNLLSNGFSLGDKDNCNRTAFEIFVEKRNFKMEKNVKLYKTIKDISTQIGNYDILLKGVKDSTKEKVSAFLPDLKIKTKEDVNEL